MAETPKTEKPKTFAALAKKRGDATADTIKNEPTTAISGAGLQGSGKTLWGLRYMPTPILHLNFDRPSEGLYYQKGDDGALLIPKERQQQIVTVPLGPEIFKDDATSWSRMTAQMARSKLEDAIHSYLPVMEGGTVILDGGAVFNNLVQLIELEEIKTKREAKDQKLFPFDYASVNSYVSGLLGMLNRSQAHFYMTHHLAEDWGADGPIGTYHAQNNSQVPRMIEIELWFWSLCGGVTNQDLIREAKKQKKTVAPAYCRALNCQKPGHQGAVFPVRIKQNKLNKKIEGMTADNLTFEQLYLLTFGEAYKEKKV